jgi:hypothetical protein
MGSIFNSMAITNELLELAIVNLVCRCTINTPTNSEINLVYQSTITNMGMTQNFEVIPNKFNVEKCVPHNKFFKKR